MFNYFNSINGRLTLSLASFSIVILILFSILYSLVIRINRVNDYDEQIEDLYVKVSKLVTGDKLFADYEKYESNFMDRLTESNLEHRKLLVNSIFDQISVLKALQPVIFKSNEAKEQLDSLEYLLVSYNGSARKIIELAKERGFRDYGLEGRMRDAAHTLEDNILIPMEELLTLRRHEKDYFLRNDTLYVNKFKNKFNQVLQSGTIQDEARRLLDEYQSSFLKIVDIETEIGLSNNQGLRQKLNISRTNIQAISNSLSKRSSSEILKIVQISKISFLITFLFTLGLSILLVFIFKRYFVRPIINLTNFVESSSHSNLISGHIETQLTEIQFLARAFDNKQNQINEKVKELKKKNKTLKKVNSELDLFVYSTAHDLKAPLTSLLGLINVMRMESYSEKNLNQYFSMMERSIHKLNDFISDIIFYSKNNRTKFLKEKIDFKELIDQLLNHFQYLPNTSFIKFRIAIDETVSYKSDRIRVEAIIRNLVSNAIRYADMQKETSQIGIKIAPLANKIVIQISDNGVGIKQEHQDKIFKMFYRASENSDGSGLGLFIVKEMVAKLRGNFNFKSEFNKGTSFEIQIPNFADEQNETTRVLAESRLMG